MESIDALAKAVNEFEGGMVLVSHDMRLISQVAKEIWICDDLTITPYRGDIMNFKMDMRRQMGIDGDGNAAAAKLRGDASVKASEKAKEATKPKPQPKLEVVKPKVKVPTIPEAEATPIIEKPSQPPPDDATAITTATSNSGASSSTGNGASAAPKRYIPPHLRKKMAEQQ